MSLGQSFGAAAEAVIAHAGGDPTGTYPFRGDPILGIWWWIAGVPAKVFRAVWPEDEPP